MNNKTEELFTSIPQSQQSATPIKLKASLLTTMQDVADFSTVCRTCATVTEFVIPIFDGEGLQNNLAEKIRKHLPIQVRETDVLPRVVCYQCASTLLAWHELVQCCGQADAALRSRLGARAAEATIEGDTPPTDKLLESVCGRNETPQNSANDQQNKYKESAAFVAPPAGARRACEFCGARLSHAAHRAHVLAAHAHAIFRCGECDTYVDRKDFILHMSLHAVEYSDKQDRREQVRNIKKMVKDNIEAEIVYDKKSKCFVRKFKNQDAKVNDVQKSMERGSDDAKVNDVQKSMERGSDDAKVNDVQKSMERGSDPQRNEFSDHSDTESGFGPLPNSVFEAIEDSQESQSNPKIFNALENSQDSQPDSNVFETLEDTISSQPNDIEPLEVTSTQEEEHNNEKELPKKTDKTNQSPELEEGPPEPPKPTNKKSHKKSRTCPICGKMYTASSSYFYHLKHFHKGSKDHECEVCGKRFGTKACLMQHQPIHTGECRYECKECSKKFRSRASLYIHEQTHSGVKTWACSQCQVSFRWRTQLVRHEQRHAAERAHACGTCGRGFSVRADLLRHARTHAGGELACGTCGLKFAQSRYLKVHMNRKHSA